MNQHGKVWHVVHFCFGILLSVLEIVLLLPQAGTNCPVFSRDEHESFFADILCLEGYWIMEIVKIFIYVKFFTRFTYLCCIFTTLIYAAAFILTHLLPMHPFLTPWKYQNTRRSFDVLKG